MNEFKKCTCPGLFAAKFSFFRRDMTVYAVMGKYRDQFITLLMVNGKSNITFFRKKLPTDKDTIYLNCCQNYHFFYIFHFSLRQIPYDRVCIFHLIFQVFFGTTRYGYTFFLWCLKFVCLITEIVRFRYNSTQIYLIEWTFL